MMDKMQAIVLEQQADNPTLRVVEKSIPVPKKGQVLVNIEVAPVNPSDVMFLTGRYRSIVDIELPVVPGFVASGTVVATGGGIIDKLLLGKRVSCGGMSGGDGTWSQYVLTESRRCIPLTNKISFESGSNLLANPTTAWALLSLVKKGRHKAAIQNASAGDVGSMMRYLARQQGIPLINIVRSEEQAEYLHKAGERYVVNSSDSQYQNQLESLCCRLQATIGFDAVAGESCQELLSAMPVCSELIVYGRLSDKDSKLDVFDVIVGRKQRLSGFNLYHWVEAQSLPELAYHFIRIRRFLSAYGEMNVQHKVGLTSFVDSFNDYRKNTTQGKTLIYPRLG